MKIKSAIMSSGVTIECYVTTLGCGCPCTTGCSETLLQNSHTMRPQASYLLLVIHENAHFNHFCIGFTFQNWNSVLGWLKHSASPPQ